MEQKEQVLRWFRTHKYINRRNAMDMYPAIWNLPDVIMRLRQDGYPIETVAMKKGKRYVKYRLGEDYGRAADDRQDNR